MALAARRVERLDALADELAGSGAPKPVVVEADLFDDRVPPRLVRQVRDELGHIDVLVNNAGVGYSGRFEDHAPEQIEHLIQLNMRALVRLTHLVLPEMIERRSGWILNVASTAAYQPIAYMTTYAASKAFVLSFSEGLWAEMRQHGVVVTSLNPGTTRTEFFDHHGWNKAREMFMKRAMTAEAVAEIGVRALARGKPSAACGKGNRVLAAISALLPRSWSARLTAKALRPAGS